MHCDTELFESDNKYNSLTVLFLYMLLANVVRLASCCYVEASTVQSFCFNCGLKMLQSIAFSWNKIQWFVFQPRVFG